MTIKGVFFDLGGTLFSYVQLNNNRGSALLNAVHKLAGSEKPDPKFIGASYRQASSEIAKDYAKLDYYLHADLFEDTFKRLTEILGISYEQNIYAEYQKQQQADIVNGLQLKHDCHDTLQALKDNGLYLSIVSNIDENMLQPLVERERLHDYLDHWTSSEAARSCKPHRRFFEVSLEKAGLRPEEVLFVGDSPEHDVNGASPLGMRTVLIRNGDEPAPLQSGEKNLIDPDHTIIHLSELLELV